MEGGYAADHAQMAATVVAKRLSGILRSRISRAGPARLTGRPSQGRIAIHWPRKDKLGLLPAAKPFMQLRCPTFRVPRRGMVTFAPKVTPAQRQILYKHIKVTVVYIIIIKE